MTVRKQLRFYPKKYSQHQAILVWLSEQRGSDNENLIYLMSQGLKVETGDISHRGESSSSKLNIQDLLPEIRKVVSAAIQSTLKEADIQLSPKEQQRVADQETQNFIRDMADNF